jgi:hypothetical protein
VKLEFLARCYRSALFLIPLAGLFTLVYAGPLQAAGFVLAALLGVLNLRMIEECAVQWIRPGGARKGRLLAAVAVKMAVVYGGGFVLLTRGVGSPAALAGGFSMIFAVIVLKALGYFYVNRNRLETAAPATGAAGRKEHP